MIFLQITFDNVGDVYGVFWFILTHNVRARGGKLNSHSMATCVRNVPIKIIKI